MTHGVLYVITDSGIGGTEKALNHLLLNLDKSQVRASTVVVLKSEREMADVWRQTGVRVVSLGLKKWPSPSLLWRFLQLIRETKPAIVHAFLYHSIQISRVAKAIDPSFRLITSPRVNYRFAPIWALSVDRLLKSFDDQTVTESEAGRQSLINHLGYNPEKVSVARTSVDPEVFHFEAEARKKIRAEWKVADTELLIGAVGRLHRQKGFDVLIRALDQVGKGPLKFRAVIVGQGPEEEALKALAQKHRVPVIFPGERTDMADIFSAFDIFVQSSRYEGLSNALLEAMSSSCPCVATAVDGTLDFAKDAENMLLVKPNDDLALATALGVLLDRPELRSKLAGHATITAREFSAARMVESFQRAYHSVLSQP